MRRPSSRARRLANTLRALREEVGMAQHEAAKKLRFSHAKISRIETGQVPDYHEFRAMLDVYGVPVSEWDHYLYLREKATEKGWWHAYGKDGRGYVALEDAASEVMVFQYSYVHGLLQTEHYMREVFVSASKPLVGETLEKTVAARLRRQRRLVEEPLLQLHVIMDVTALHPRVCVGDAHREQLDAILERATLPNVTVQVLPESTGAYDGLLGNIAVLSFPDAEDKDMAYVEHILGAVHADRESQVHTAKAAFQDFADRALDQEDSVALIDRLRTVDQR